MTDFVSSSGDGMIYGKATFDYATARSTSTGFDITADNHRLGQWTQNTGIFYDNWTRRIFLKFDTSALTSNAVISSVKLRLTAKTDDSTTNFDIQIVKQDWSSQDPIAAGTREAAYDNCLSGTADSSIWRNTSGMSLNTPYESGELSTTWVNKTGYTYYSLRSSLDFAGTQGSNDFAESESIVLYTSEVATSAYRPYLVITYTKNYMVINMNIYSH